MPVLFTHVKQVCRDDTSMVLDVEFSQLASQSNDVMDDIFNKARPIYMYYLQDTDNIMKHNTIVIVVSTIEYMKFLF